MAGAAHEVEGMMADAANVLVTNSKSVLGMMADAATVLEGATAEAADGQRTDGTLRVSGHCVDDAWAMY